MELSSKDTLTILSFIILIVAVGSLAYIAGVQTVDSQRLIYYEIGLSDGYEQGMNQCGNAGWRFVDKNGTQWMEYEPKNVFDGWDIYPTSV